MKPEIFTALISALAGLFGALIGFTATFFTNRQTVAQAREQRRFERAQEMRAEVIPRLFVYLASLQELFDWRLDYALRATEEFRNHASEVRKAKQELEGTGEIWSAEQAAAQLEKVSGRLDERIAELKTELDAPSKQLDELHDYFKLHDIWLPQSLESGFEEFLDKYVELLSQVERAEAEWANKVEFEDFDDIDEALDSAQEYYELQLRKMRDWFEGERRRLEADLRTVARKVLGIEEDYR